MNYKTIEKLQKENGYAEMQEMVNNGSVWIMEGSVGRTVMSNLREGSIMLPKESFKDYYGNVVPSRDMLKDGTTGTYQNSVNFWMNYETKF